MFIVILQSHIKDILYLKFIPISLLGHYLYNNTFLIIQAFHTYLVRRTIRVDHI